MCPWFGAPRYDMRGGDDIARKDPNCGVEGGVIEKCMVTQHDDVGLCDGGIRPSPRDTRPLTRLVSSFATCR